MKLLRLILPVLLFVATHNISHAHVFKILKTRGLVKIDEKNAQPDQLFIKGTLKTHSKSYAIVEIQETGARIVFGPQTEVILEEYKKQQYRSDILSGAIRWISGKQKRAGYMVTTPTIAIGIRGTDFYAVYDKELSETELLLFEGLLEVENKKSSQNKVMVEPGMWLGNGGRFGMQIRNMQAPQSTIKKYKNILQDETSQKLTRPI